LLHSQKSVESGVPDYALEHKSSFYDLYRTIEQLFYVRAMYRLGKGDIDGAIEDKLTIHRLERSIPPQLTWFHRLFSSDKMSTAIPVPAHPLTEKQIRRLLEGLDALPPHPSINDYYEFERYHTLSAFRAIVPAAEADREHFAEWLVKRAGGDPSEMHPILMASLQHFAPRLLHSLDLDVVDRRVNELYDAVQEPLPRKKFHSLVEDAEKLELTSWKTIASLLLSREVFSKTFIDMTVASSVPSMSGVEQACLRLQCAENMQRLTLAILLYQCEHGKMPDENWVEQIKPYLGKKPDDNGVPAKYFSCPAHPSPEGRTTYALILYSIKNGGKKDGEADGNSLERLVLLEVADPVPYGIAVITPKGVFWELRENLWEVGDGRDIKFFDPPTLHSYVTLCTNQGGSVVNLSTLIERATLLRLLGGEGKSD
jgi:hypothetical protein